MTPRPLWAHTPRRLTDLHVTTYESVRDPRPTYTRLPWPGFVAELEQAGHTPLADKLLGRLWSPVRLADGATRSNGSVLEVSAIVLDLDHKSSEEIAAVLDDVTAAGLEAYAHTTHTHDPEIRDRRTPAEIERGDPPRMAEDCRVRVILPLAEPILARAFLPVWRAAALRWGGDPACKDVSRAYFLPSRALDAPDVHWSLVLPGRPINATDLAVESPRDAAPRTDPARELVLSEELLRRIVARKLKSRRIGDVDIGQRLQKILDGIPYAVDGERDDITWRVVCALVRDYPQIDAAAFTERMAPSLAAMGDGAPNPAGILEKFRRAKASALERITNVERPAVTYSPADEHSATDFALGCLAAADVYARGGVLSHVIRTGPDRVAISPCPPERIREEIGMRSSWFKADGDELLPIGVPKDVVGALCARPSWGDVRDLVGVSPFPVVRSDGEIVTEGYDPETCVIVSGSPVVVAEGSIEALSAELLDLVSDFPFTDLTGVSAWLAATLTPFARFAFNGPVPLYVIDKSAPGTGGTLLADIAGIVSTGTEIPKQTYTPGEELEKRIMAIALAGSPWVLFDNVGRALGDDHMNQVITSTEIEGRLLGSTTRLVLPWRAQIVATGNNVRIRGDLSRRVIYSRLDAHCERPELRTGFSRPSILGWARGNVARLRGLALGIVAQSVRLGPLDLPSFGSFEAWSDVVRSAVVRSGMPDPLDSQAMAPTDGGDLDALRALLVAMKEIGGAHSVQSWADLGIRHPGLAAALADLDTGGDLRKLGYRFRAMKDRIAGGLKLVRIGRSDWCAE